MIHSKVDAWIANTGGSIGFWSYTVTQELGPVPEPGTLLLLASVLPGLAARAKRSG